METLSTKDWRRLNEVALDLHSVDTPAELPGRVLTGLRELFPYDAGSIQDDRGGIHNIPWFHGEEVLWQPPVNADRRKISGLRMMAPWGPNFLPLREAFFEVSAEHHPHTAYYRRTGDRASRRISEIVPTRRLRQTRFYNEISRPHGIHWQLTIYTPLTHAGTLAAARQRTDFSERERQLLDLLRPHVAAAWRRARPETHESLGGAVRDRFHLTAREAEILHWLAQGKRNSEIGIICEVATATVETHLKNIFVKLGVETRTAAAAMALGSA